METFTVHHKGNHYTNVARDRAMRESAKLGDYLCHQINVWRASQGKPAYSNADLRTHSSRINNRDDSHTPPVANEVIKAMGEYEVPFGAKPEVQRIIANMNERALDQERRRQRADEYCRRDREQRRLAAQRAVTNSDAVKRAIEAMSQNTGAVAFFANRKREGR
jgi:hypothetical protein